MAYPARTKPHRCRTALARPLEYRFRYGDSSDRLFAVFDHPIEDYPVELLEALGIIPKSYPLEMAVSRHSREGSSPLP
jgi:hypothetical protein